MSIIKKNDIVRLLTGETCMIINLPGTFMSNGSYEVIEVEMSTNGKYKPIKSEKFKKQRWVKPNEIAYDLTQTDNSEQLSNYVEIIYDGQEIHFIPKDIKSVELVTDENGFSTIKLTYEGHLHNTINILIGNNEIINKNEKS